MTHLKLKILLSCSFLLLVLIIVNCAQVTVQRKYYLLDYPGVASDSALITGPPLPLKVMVHTMKLPRTYDRTNIVVRYSAHQIDYYRYSLWAIKPQIIISDLIARQIQANKLFLKCEREFLDENPDYEIIGYINAIEKFHNEEFTAAHLSMTLYLRRGEDFQLVVKHQFDRQEQLYSADMSFFAKKMSDILREETDKMNAKIVAYFKEKEKLHQNNEEINKKINY